MIQGHVAQCLKEIEKSEEWLSEKSGISVKTKKKIENMTYLPLITEAIIISKALGKKTEEIFVLVK